MHSHKLLRVSIALLFLWFGLSQLINPESWFGYVPQWLVKHPYEVQHEHPLQLAHSIPKPGLHALVMLNGLFETVLGGALLAGIFTRWVALLLSAHLGLIALSLGYNDLAIRDLALAAATFSVFLRKGELTRHPSAEQG